jgi:hypothetical protein
MTRLPDGTFERGGLMWQRRWAVAQGEHPSAGRYVWEAGRLTVWIERRWFAVVPTTRGVVKGERAIYRAAIDRAQVDGEWPTLLMAMDAAIAWGGRRAGTARTGVAA